jgi:hypothetical protein
MEKKDIIVIIFLSIELERVGWHGFPGKLSEV